MRSGVFGVLVPILVCLIVTPSFATQSNSFEVSAVTQSPEGRELEAKIDNYMQASVQHDAFSGNILIARNGLPVVIKSYGMANYELKVPNTPHTVFGTASLTKAFTAMAIMQLQEKGELNVGDPICRYLSDCPGCMAAGYGPSINDEHIGHQKFLKPLRLG